MIRCSRCNNLNPEGSIACNRCGQVLPSNNKAIQGQKQYQQMNIQNQVYGDGYVQQDFTQQNYEGNEMQQDMSQQSMDQQDYGYNNGVQSDQTYAQNGQDYGAQGNQSYTYGIQSYDNNYNGYNNQGYTYNYKKPKTGLIIIAVLAIIGLIFCCCIVGVIVKALKEADDSVEATLEDSSVAIMNDIEAPEDDFDRLDDYDEESLDNNDYSYDNSGEYSGTSTNLYVDYPDINLTIADSVGVKINVNPYFIKYDGSNIEIPCDLSNSNESAVEVNVLDIRIDGDNTRVSNIDLKTELGSGTVIDGLPQSLFNVPIKATLNNVSSLENLHEIAIDFNISSINGSAVIKDCKLINLDNPDSLTYEAGYVDSDVSSFDLDRADSNNSENSESVWGTLTTKLYGSQDVGFVRLPDNYVDFLDVDVPAESRGAMKQYTDGEVIVTLNLIHNGDAQGSISSMYNSLTNDSSYRSVSKDSNFVGDIKADGTYPMQLESIMAIDNTGYMVLVNCWYSDLTQYETDMVYCAIEAPSTMSNSEFAETVNKILKTHTLGRFSK